MKEQEERDCRGEVRGREGKNLLVSELLSMQVKRIHHQRTPPAEIKLQLGLTLACSGIKLFQYMTN